jgi:hypothetical protein
MTRDVLVSLLRQGSTGSEILQILDTLDNGMVSDSDSSFAAEPTLDSIEF